MATMTANPITPRILYIRSIVSSRLPRYRYRGEKIKLGPHQTMGDAPAFRRPFFPARCMQDPHNTRPYGAPCHRSGRQSAPCAKMPNDSPFISPRKEQIEHIKTLKRVSRGASGGAIASARRRLGRPDADGQVG